MILSNFEKHPVFTHSSDLNDLCAPLKEINITAFSHLRVFEDNKLTGLSNHPDFVANYLSKKYYEADPCVSIKPEFVDIGQYVLWDHVECYGKTADMVHDSAEFNFKHIFTVIKKHEEYQDFFHFGTHIIDSTFNQVYINNLESLSHFIDFFNIKVSNSRELSKAYNIPLNADQKMFDAFINVRGVFQSTNIFAKSFFASLTAKEIECANLVVLGKTTKEIAAIFNLSARTIEDRINSLKHKLNARNKSELIIKLLNVSNGHRNNTVDK